MLAGLLAATALADAARFVAPALPVLLPAVAQALALAAALGFTIWYPKHMRRRAGGA